MTLMRVRPASINSGKLVAFLLIAMGIVAIAYHNTRFAAGDAVRGARASHSASRQSAATVDSNQ